jgi:predicted RND superfamily exporter protein
MLPVLFSILVVLCGVSWSLGILAISGYQITVLTALIPPLLIVIGIPNCIMLLNKYHLEFSLHGNRIKALSRSMARVALSLIMANLTTAIGFAVFCSTDTQVLFEFGLIASVSVILTCLLSLVMLPLIFSYLPPPRAGHTRHLQGSTMRNLLSSIDRLVHFRRKQVYLVAAILLCISLCGLLLIKPLGYVVDDLPKNDPVLADLRYFEKHFGGVLPLEILIDTKKNNGIPGEGGTVLYRINKLQRALAAHTQLSRPLSIAEGIKFLNQAFEDGKPNAYRLPGAMELEKLSGFVSEDSRSHDKLFSYIDSAKRYARLSYQMADIGTGKMQLLLDTIRPKIDSALNYDYSIPAWKKAAERLSFSITGNSIIFLKGNSFLVKNLLESVLLALVLIAFVLYSLFMSPRMIAVSLLPSFLPLVLTAGLMGFAGIAIKPSTILVFSIAFGIASDGTLYFLTRYRQEMRRGDVSISSAVSATIAETGFGMVYTAVILSCGFGIFAASSFGGTAALGILISFTLLVAYCSNLILLPCFLLTLEKRITNKAFMQEPLIDVYDEETDIDLDELEIEQKKEQKDN